MLWHGVPETLHLLGLAQEILQGRVTDLQSRVLQAVLYLLGQALQSTFRVYRLLFRGLFQA